MLIKKIIKIKKEILNINNICIISYPTESSFGIGCNPFSKISYQKILSIKKSNRKKKMIIVTDTFDKISSLTTLKKEYFYKITKKFPKIITFIIPAKKNYFPWLNKNNKIAIRISTHPMIKKICKILTIPIISTSANITNSSPLYNMNLIKKQFKENINYFINGKTRYINNSTPMFDIILNKYIRK